MKLEQDIINSNLFNNRENYRIRTATYIVFYLQKARVDGGHPLQKLIDAGLRRVDDGQCVVHFRKQRG